MMTVVFSGSNSYNVYDVYSQGNNQPSDDVSLGGTYDFTNLVFSNINGVYSLSWDRPLITGDKYDINLLTGINITMSYAYANGDISVYHGVNYGLSSMMINSNNLNVSFGKTTPSGAIDIYQVKGVIMIICWSFLNLAGVLAAVYFRHLTYWIHIHRICSGGAAFLTVVTGVFATINSIYYIYYKHLVMEELPILWMYGIVLLDMC